MQKWEYCAKFRITTDIKGVPEPVETNLTYFLQEGPSVTTIGGNRSENELIALARVIASLGVEGWEMVGCGNTAERSHCLYFKRVRN